MTTNNDILYYEKLSSKRMEWLFLALTGLFLLLCAWRMAIGGWGGWTATFFVLCCIFLFYSVNYRTLIIRILPGSLTLSFGVFTWAVPFENIDSCSLDELPTLMKYGGAGIHFMNIRKRYRASFNFLEYPRVVIAFKRKAGPVRDLSFSTRQPEEVLRIIQRERSTRRS